MPLITTRQQPPRRALAALGGAVTLLALAACTFNEVPEPRPLTVVTAGDIACTPKDEDFNAGAGTSNSCRQRATSDLVDRLGPNVVLALGDTQYERATMENFQASYHPTWGRFKDITRPVPGNHEYLVDDAEDYYEYFGEAAGDPKKGYYSFHLGDWHLIALNSECDEVGGCGPGAPQERWLRADLAANQKQCTLAYWHQPRFSSGKTHGNDGRYDAFWRALYDFGAEIAVSGHDHHYERFAPLNPEGRVDTQRGVRQFIAGTGGEALFPVGEPVEGSKVTDDTTFGVLEFTLLADEYRWRFHPVPGGSGFTDSGSASCH